MLIFFITVWAALIYGARRCGLSFILSWGGTLIVALVLLMIAVELTQPSKEPAGETPAEPAAAAGPKTSPAEVDAGLQEMWDALPPPPEAVKGMSLADVTALYWKLKVMDWNGEMYFGTRRWKGMYSELAEKWEMHVDVIAAAYDYVQDERLYRLSNAVGKHFENDPHIMVARLAPTAWGGLYTFHAQLRLEGSPKDPALDGEARKIAESLVRKFPPWITGMKIQRVGYSWPKTGTSGNLTPAFLWRRQPEEFRVMSIDNEMSNERDSLVETRWVQPSWNEGRRAE